MVNLYSIFRKKIRKIIGYYRSKRVKSRVKECGEMLRVNGKSIIPNNISLGNNVNFNGIKILGGGKVSIGNNFHSGVECMLITQNHNYDFGKAIPYDDTYITKDILIKDNVWIGNRVILMGGISVGEGAIIQAGSVVANDIPDCAIVGGHPAKVFRYRDKKHYYELKSEQKFH